MNYFLSLDTRPQMTGRPCANKDDYMSLIAEKSCFQ